MGAGGNRRLCSYLAKVPAGGAAALFLQLFGIDENGIPQEGGCAGLFSVVIGGESIIVDIHLGQAGVGFLAVVGPEIG